MNYKRWLWFLTYEHQSEHAYVMPDGKVHMHPALYEKVRTADGPERIQVREGELRVEGGATIVRNPYCPLGPRERRWIWER